jgi:1-deoxy-D-xylulose-5-phosphate synthase
MKNKKLLDKIKQPPDLKGLSFEELEALAQEIRAELIERVSRTGGHLAPNLGVVELSIALHYVLESPKDKIIWDVGHQSYVHKMLTGRRSDFATLRQYGGLSGFPKRSESEHDVVDTGHSSTSLAFAIGLAEAKKKRGESGKVVAVIGDGALTAGMAYEALNHGGHLKSDVLIILNDNEMSISPSVGAFSAYLGRVRLDSHFRRWEEGIQRRIREIPGIGETMYEVAKHIKSSIKQLVLPGMLFEELGFKYIGPLDGHNIELLANQFRMAKELKEPVLIHVITKKGKGYPPAEANPDKFHGTNPFIIKSGEPSQTQEVPSYTEVFGQTLAELASQNQNIVAVTAAMTLGTGLDKFASAFSDRFYDVGIAEQHAVAFGAALALAGLKPVVAIYSTFLQRAYDQIIHDVCLQNLGVVFAIDRAGVVGEDGPTHHGVFDLSYLLSIPNITIMAPKDEDELRHMLKTACEMEAPVAIRYPRRAGYGVDISQPLRRLSIGRAEILREGERVLMVAIGTMVGTALEAADILETKGIRPTVVNARFVKPLDEKLIRTLAGRHELLATLEENTLAGGFGSQVLRSISAEGILMPVLTFGLKDKFVEHGKIEVLLEKQGLDASTIAEAIIDRLFSLESSGKLLSNIKKTFLSKISSFNGAKRETRRSAG